MKQFVPFTNKSSQDILNSFSTSLETGLTAEQIVKNAQQYGKNILLNHEVSWFHIFYKQFASPFIYLLAAIGVLAYFLEGTLDAIMIFSLLLINALIGFYQEYKAHRQAQQIKAILTDKTQVIREGTVQVIPIDELVVADIVILKAGDIIPADVRLLETENLTIDESLLTGESHPVVKNTQPAAREVETVFEAANIGFRGTTVISGKAKAVVIATGANTQVGALSALQIQPMMQSSFARSMQTFSQFILYVVIATIVLLFIAHYTLSTGTISTVNLIIFCMVLGISIVPESLPVVTIFSLVRGAHKLAKNKVIIKRLAAIEDLGSVQVLCTDKTGTLTENTLKVAQIFAQDVQQTVRYALLTFGSTGRKEFAEQGFEKPLYEFLTQPEKQIFSDCVLEHEVPYDPLRRHSSAVVVCDKQRLLLVSGVTIDIVPLCSLSAEKAQDAIAQAQEQEAQGRRVLAVAAKKLSQTEPFSESLETSLELIGLIAFEDPLKETVIKSLEKARSLGVAIKVLSGDTREVCASVGRKINLITDDSQLITGDEFSSKSQAEKERLVEQCVFFARVLPEQKYEIISLLEKNYDVGYLGDGINDVPALKISQVSIAVSNSADVARDAADIILLQKSLGVIVDAIHEGRIIFANIVKYIQCTLSANFGHFYSLAITSLFIDFLPVLPTQILLIDLLTDLPLIAISADTVGSWQLRRPKKYDVYTVATVSALFGLVIMAADFSVVYMFYDPSHPAVLQTNWFISTILIELSSFYSIRTPEFFLKAKRPPLAVTLISLGVAFLALTVPYTTIGQKVLHFAPPSRADLATIFLVVLFYFVVTECLKLVLFRFMVQKNKI